MKILLYILLIIGGSMICLINVCLMVSTGIRDRMEEELFIGKKDEGPGKDGPEDDKGRSCSGEPE